MQVLVGFLEILIRHVIRQEVDRVVDLVESQPVSDQTLELFKTGLCELHEKRDQFPVLPVAQCLFKLKRRIKVPDRDQRLDSVFLQLLKDTAIELDSFPVRLFLHAGRIDP